MYVDEGGSIEPVVAGDDWCCCCCCEKACKPLAPIDEVVGV